MIVINYNHYSSQFSNLFYVCKSKDQREMSYLSKGKKTEKHEETYKFNISLIEDKIIHFRQS